MMRPPSIAVLLASGVLFAVMSALVLDPGHAQQEGAMRGSPGGRPAAKQIPGGAITPRAAAPRPPAMRPPPGPIGPVFRLPPVVRRPPPVISRPPPVVRRPPAPIVRPPIVRPPPPIALRRTYRPWRPGLSWRWLAVPTIIIAQSLDWCHYHTYRVVGMRFHRNVECHGHVRWDHPSLRYVEGY